MCRAVNDAVKMQKPQITTILNELNPLWSLRSLESGFHMIAMIAAIVELFFFLSDLYEPSVHMETGLKSWRSGKEIRPKSVRHHAHVVRAE